MFPLIEYLEDRRLMSSTIAVVRRSTVQAVEGESFAALSLVQFRARGATVVGVSAVINWGDGTSSPGNVTDLGSGTFTVGGGHQYAEEGKQRVSVQVSDSAGGKGSAVMRATVQDAPLTGTGNNFSAVKQRKFSAVVCSFTDAGAGATGSSNPVWTATISWGDGKNSIGTIGFDPASGSFTVSGSHTYANSGAFSVTTTIKDRGGSKAVVRAAANILTLTATVDHLEIDPAAAQIHVGEQIQFTAQAFDAAGDVVNLPIHFDSSDLSIATVGFTEGLATGQSPGTVSITADANIDGKDVTAQLTVQPEIDRVQLSLDSPTLVVGKTLQASGIAFDAAGNQTPGTFVFSSSDPALASVDPTSGLITGVSPGSVTITATEQSSHKSDSAQITVKDNKPGGAYGNVFRTDSTGLTEEIPFEIQLSATDFTFGTTGSSYLPPIETHDVTIDGDDVIANASYYGDTIVFKIHFTDPDHGTGTQTITDPLNPNNDATFTLQVSR